MLPKRDRAGMPPLKHLRADRMVLDSQMFPHILETIADHAPHASLIALRAGNRALRRRCDALLARHIVMSNRTVDDPQFYLDQFGLEREGPINVFGPRGRLPIFYQWDYMICESLGRFGKHRDALSEASWVPRDSPPPEGMTEQEYYAWYEGANNRRHGRRAKRALCLHSTRVLDFVGPVPTYRRAELLSGIRDLDVMRFLPDERGYGAWADIPPNDWENNERGMRGSSSFFYTQSKAIVSFRHLTGPRAPPHPRRIARSGFQRDNAQDIPDTDSLSPPCGVASLRLVYTFFFQFMEHFDPPGFAAPPWFYQDTVIIFVCTHPVCRLGPQERTPPEHMEGIRWEKAGGVLSEIIAQSGGTLRSGTMTFVGTDTLLPSLLGLEPDASPADIAAMITSHIHDDVEKTCKEDVVQLAETDGLLGDADLWRKDRMNRLSFLTLDEYRASVSEEQFALDTVE